MFIKRSIKTISYELIIRKILFKIKWLFDDVRGLSLLLVPLYDTGERITN